LKRIIGIIIISSTVSAALTVLIYHNFIPPSQVIIREALSNPIPAQYRLQHSGYKGAEDFNEAAEKITPAVVNVRAIKETASNNQWNRNRKMGATGSGVIVSADGYIVTNRHVVFGADQLEITLANKRKYTGELIGTDRTTDLALIKIKERNLPYALLGNSDHAVIGEWVLAVGNPFNLASTVTAGIISAKGRSIDILEGQDRIESFIQTDAAVNPGNSGGALVNAAGELIGINTAIITQSGRYEGYSFAIPSNLVSKVIADLTEYGIVQRGLLGVFIDDITPQLADELQLKEVAGVLITQVGIGSGAQDAGLKKNDVIISVNGISTPSLPKMQEQIGRLRPGNQVMIGFYRNGQLDSAQVVLKNKSNTTTLINAADDKLLMDIGFEIRELTAIEQKRLKTSGVRIYSIYRNSLIDRTNMDPGFIVTKINDLPVSDITSFLATLKKFKREIVLEGIYEDFEGPYFYNFTLEEIL
jgi:Do/DeqQ family serine protease